MPTKRGISVVLSLLAISLSACASASGAYGPGPDTRNAAYHSGYHVGWEARLRYAAQPDSSLQNLPAYCAELAYVDIQPMKGGLVAWSEGFDAGCQSRL
jgi:hypothetical protein